MNPLQIPQNTTNAGATLELFVNQQKNEKKVVISKPLMDHVMNQQILLEIKYSKMPNKHFHRMLPTE